MKILWITALTLLMSSTAYAESIRDVQDRHSEERHVAQKEWDLNKKECYATYPKWTDSSHPDYDKNFECQKKIKALRYKLDDKHAVEICEKFNVCRH